MKAEMLHDEWSFQGAELKPFFELLKDISTATYYVELATDELTLMSMLEADSEKCVVALHDSNEHKTNTPKKARLSLEKLRDRGVPPLLLKETIEQTKLFMRLNNKGALKGDIYLTSEHLSRDIGARAKLSGDAVHVPTTERDFYITSRYFKAPQKAKAIVRFNSDGNKMVHKVFALASNSYALIDQDYIEVLMKMFSDELGEPECLNWEVSNFETSITLRFPEHRDDFCSVMGRKDGARLTPCIRFETSDTGDSSIKVALLWHVDEKSLIKARSISRRHQGNIDFHDYLEDKMGDVISEYKKLPQRLCDLALLDISDPITALEDAFKMLPEAKKVLGQKRFDAVLDDLKKEFAHETDVTAYDIAMGMMNIPGKYKNSDSLLKGGLEAIAYKAAFIDWERIERMSLVA